MSQLDSYNPEFFSHQQCGESGDITVIQVLAEKLTEDQNLEEFGTQLFAFVENYDCRKIAVNCEQVLYATSSAIGKFITMHRKLQRVDGTLVLCNLQASFADVLQTSKLFDWFNVVDTQDAAVESLGNNPPEPGADVA